MIMFPSTHRDYVSSICDSNKFIQCQKQPPEVFYKETVLILKNTYLEEHLRTAASALSEL